MNSETRKGLATICYGAALALVGGVLYLVDVDLISAIGALVLGGGGILILFGLLQTGRGVTAGE